MQREIQFSVKMPGVERVSNMSRNEMIFSLLVAEYLPKPEGRSSSGRGQQAAGASETQSGGHPRTARQPDDTTTPANAPTYTPEHPGGAKESDSRFRFIFIQLVNLSAPILQDKTLRTRARL